VSTAIGQAKKPAAAQAMRSLTVKTEPGAAVWVDSVFFGKTGDGGKLVIRSVPAGNRTLRVRHDGFKESAKPLGPAVKGEIAVALIPTTDPAELAYQEAVRLTSVDRQKAIAAFEKAISLRPRFPEAYLGLARTLSESGDFERADTTIKQLKKIRPGYAEASAVEGRINKDVDDEPKAIASFKRAITEGGGYQPEAYTGLGLLYKEKAENAGSAGDYNEESANNAEAAKYLAVAVKQLASAPDAAVVYQLLGLIYEREKRFDEAVRVYQEFLKLFPDAPEASAVQSFIDQIRKQSAQPD
jgi:tetratricopeptide (TPR) repeat protein